MPTQQHAAPGLRVWLALGTVYVVWGSTYLGIAVAIESMPPFLMLALRFAIAGGLLLGWELLRNGRSILPTRREVRDSAIVGSLLLGIGNGFVALAEKSVPSGIAAILIALMPVWLAVLGWVYFRDRLPRIVILGVLVGLVGVVLLIWPFGGGDDKGFDLLGIAALILSPIGWSHGSLFAARRARLPKQALVATALQMLFGSAFLLLEGVLTGELGRFHPEAITLRSLVALLYLITIGSMLAFNAYAWLLRHAPLSLIGTYAYVNPVVAVALGAIFLAEPISARTLIASAVIVAAVAVIVTARGRAGHGEEAETPEEAIRGSDSSSEAGLGSAAESGGAVKLERRRGSAG
jgi:drug/metabolite transporter (DMT)-like permease